MFINVCMVFGIDYQTYYCVAILKHLNVEQNIVQHHTDKDLQIFMKENQIVGFIAELDRKNLRAREMDAIQIENLRAELENLKSLAGENKRSLVIIMIGMRSGSWRNRLRS